MAVTAIHSANSMANRTSRVRLLPPLLPDIRLQQSGQKYGKRQKVRKMDSFFIWLSPCQLQDISAAHAREIHCTQKKMKLTRNGEKTSVLTIHVGLEMDKRAPGFGLPGKGSSGGWQAKKAAGGRQGVAAIGFLSDEGWSGCAGVVCTAQCI